MNFALFIEIAENLTIKINFNRVMYFGNIYFVYVFCLTDQIHFKVYNTKGTYTCHSGLRMVFSYVHNWMNTQHIHSAYLVRQSICLFVICPDITAQKLPKRVFWNLIYIIAVEFRQIITNFMNIKSKLKKIFIKVFSFY